MKIIGHRGAAGLALENTLPSIELARLLGVDAIEFDVRMTKDRQLVLCHDATLDRISDSGDRVRNLTLKELKKIVLRDGESRMPSLQEALKVVGSVPVILDLKEAGCEKELLKVIDELPKLDISIVSLKHESLAILRKMRPGLKLYGSEFTKPTEIIHIAKRLKLHGVALNFWILNPLSYYLVKRAGLDVFVFTVNTRILGSFVKLLYPRVSICSDHPERFLKHPYPVVQTIRKIRNNRGNTASRSKIRKLKRIT
jgi:glycerophosphoryl diester phosphodiesterase